MILGIEDITGGATLLAFLIWLGFTGLFYVVMYLTVLNVSDDFTKNSFLKIPLLLLLTPMASLKQLQASFSHHIKEYTILHLVESLEGSLDLTWIIWIKRPSLEHINI